MQKENAFMYILSSLINIIAWCIVHILINVKIFALTCDQVFLVTD